MIKLIDKISKKRLDKLINRLIFAPALRQINLNRLGSSVGRASPF